MATQKVLVVPGMPLAALNAIADVNTRQVLTALVDAHNVRNGATGKGDDRFVTASEVGLINGNNTLIINVAGEAPAKGALLSPAAINRIINDLEASVIESPLFKDLGERVDLIDAPGGLIDQFDDLKDGYTAIKKQTDNSALEIKAIQKTVYDPSTGLASAQAKIGEINNISVTSTSAAAQQLALVSSTVYNPVTGLAVATANIASEKTTRVNSDNALALAVNTIWSNIGNNSALVQSGSETITNQAGAIATNWNQTQAAIKDSNGNIISSAAVKQTAESAVSITGEINAKYTVKIDNNGYVSGYGLMSTANNSIPFAEFIVRADRFAIGSPAGPDITPTVPFIVLTTPQTVNGQVVFPGVYMRDAVIMNGSISRAKIGDLQVDTLKIAGDSVMVGVYDEGGTVFVPVGGSINLINRSIDLGDQYNSGLIMSATIYCDANSNETIGFKIFVNGVVAGDMRASMRAGFGTLFPATGFATPNTRFANVVLQAYDPGTGHSPFRIVKSTLSILGGKR